MTWKTRRTAVEVNSGLTVVSWHGRDVHLPFFSSSRRPQAQPFGVNMFFLFTEIQIMRNYESSFIKLQPPVPLILSALRRACTSPSAFIDHASILFSKTEVWRKPLLSTGNPDSIKKLMQFLIFYLLSLVHRFLYFNSYIPVSKIFLVPVAMVKACLKKKNYSSKIHWPTK